MNHTAAPAESAPAGLGSSPSTIEIILGLLALLLALAAVVIAAIQLHQVRTASHRPRQPEPELGQINIELPIVTNHVADIDSVGNNAR
jgi:flagellar basal body-associated protein FliL